MYNPGNGDIVICNDVLGSVIDYNGREITVRVEDGNNVKLNRNANITLVANSYSIAALVYNKLLTRIGK